MVTKFATNPSGAIWLANLQLMQAVPCHGVNFWVRCASGNIFTSVLVWSSFPGCPNFPDKWSFPDHCFPTLEECILVVERGGEPRAIWSFIPMQTALLVDTLLLLLLLLFIIIKYIETPCEALPARLSQLQTRIIIWYVYLRSQPDL